MEQIKITSDEQKCISKCIRSHWGGDAKPEDLETRDRDYERCLSNCNVCG